MPWIETIESDGSTSRRWMYPSTYTTTGTTTTTAAGIYNINLEVDTSSFNRTMDRAAEQIRVYQEAADPDVIPGCNCDQCSILRRRQVRSRRHPAPQLRWRGGRNRTQQVPRSEAAYRFDPDTEEKVYEE